MSEKGEGQFRTLGADLGIEAAIGGEKGFEVRTLAAGTVMELRDGSRVTVVDNPHDGGWVICRYEDGSVAPVIYAEFVRLIGMAEASE